MLPGITDRWNGLATLDSWPDYEWTRRRTPTGRSVSTRSSRDGAKAARNCHFAGEHTSIDYQGYLNGAVETRGTCGRGDSRRPEVTACGTLRRGTCGPTTAEACWPRALRSRFSPARRERARPLGRFRDASLLQLGRLREPGDVRRVHQGNRNRRPQVVLRLQRGAAEAEERRPQLRPRGSHGYTIATLAEEGLLRPIAWKKLPNVRQTIDPKFLGLPHDPDDRWSVPKDWGTTGFMYRTTRSGSCRRRGPSSSALREVPAQAHAARRRHGGDRLGRRDDGLLLQHRCGQGTGAGAAVPVHLWPFVRSFDSRGYATAIARGTAYGGLGWNGDGAYVIARTERRRRVRRREGRRRAVGRRARHSRGAPNPAAAHAWIDFVYKPRISAMETPPTYFGSPGGALAARADPRADRLSQPRRLPARRDVQALEPSNLTPKGQAARTRIWAE